jgi:precorrin-2 dehydrogenase / sirohydrochlorin ferrochelatase
MQNKEKNPQRLFPAMLLVDGMKVIIVGGGTVAERKVHSLLECGADITIIAPETTQALSDLASDGRVIHIARKFRPGDLNGFALAFVAVDDEAAASDIAREAGFLGIPVNVVDKPELCTLTVPAVMRRGLLTVAVSTNGSSPAWAALIKNKLAGEFGEEYARLFEALHAIRRRYKTVIGDPAKRAEMFRMLADDTLLEAARSEKPEALEERMAKRIDEWLNNTKTDNQ